MWILLSVLDITHECSCRLPLYPIWTIIKSTYFHTKSLSRSYSICTTVLYQAISKANKAVDQMDAVRWSCLEFIKEGDHPPKNSDSISRFSKFPQNNICSCSSEKIFGQLKEFWQEQRKTSGGVITGWQSLYRKVVGGGWMSQQNIRL